LRENGHGKDVRRDDEEEEGGWEGGVIKEKRK